MAYTISTLADEAQWEWFLLREQPNALFQSWTWGEVQRRIGNTVSRFGIYEGNVLRGVFQTVDVRARRGSFLHVRHGPILSGTSYDLWQHTVEYLKSEARRKHMWFIRINPLVLPTDEFGGLLTRLHFMPAAIHRMDGEQCWVLDVSPKEEEILSGMRKSTRYEIRKAIKDGVEIFSTTNPTYLSEFNKLYNQTSTRHGFVPHKGIEEEFTLFAGKDQAVLYMGKHKGKTISAAIILYYGNQAIYHHGASLPYTVPVSHLVQWEAIRDAKKRGMKVYNFWGIAPEDSPNHPWRGITVFKKGFGGREIRYIHAQDLPVSPLYTISRSVELIRKRARGYD